MTLMFDSVDVTTIPSDAAAVAGYVGGRFPTFASLASRFPLAHLLSIAVNASQDADCLDIENGDAVPSDAPAWFNRQKARGVARPCFYADSSTMPQVLAALAEASIARKEFRVWTAHFTGQQHVEPGSDATQWTDKAFGRNLDESECLNTFFEATVPARNPPHYDWFDGNSHYVNGRLLNERKLVEKYDTQRKHPIWFVWSLPGIRRDLNTLAQRVATIAEQQPNAVTGRPSWGKYHRGWRRLELAARAQGQRFV